MGALDTACFASSWNTENQRLGLDMISVGSIFDKGEKSILFHLFPATNKHRNDPHVYPVKSKILAEMSLLLFHFLID